MTLPKGGGAIRGIGEKFAANPATGTASFAVPVPVSRGRSGFTPQLSLAYDSGSGNGVFGWGFSLGLPRIDRRTDKGLPTYRDGDEADTFVFAGAEDLVPVLVDGARTSQTRTDSDGTVYEIHAYRPRVESAFIEIERWTDGATGISHFRTIDADNVVRRFGYTDQARIADPADPARVFSWLVEDSRDDKGNILAYEYVPEDAVGVADSPTPERTRLGAGFGNRHLKRIRYGNAHPGVADGWAFEVVLDYGDHDRNEPTPDPDRPWPVRPDPFSSYRAGFEVRAYRLCRRVLMFHRFSGWQDGGPVLVRSTDLDYGDSSPVASFVRRIVQTGYIRTSDGSYRSASAPPLSLTYSQAQLDPQIHRIEADQLPDLSHGLGHEHHWVDLFHEGIAGLLTVQSGHWTYRANDGSGRFSAARTLATAPAGADLESGRFRLSDVDGDAREELVALRPPMSGYYPHGERGNWQSFVPFTSLPQLDWADPNLRLVDLTGDGRADILLTENDAWTWHAGLGRAGFGAAQRMPPPSFDLERGPREVLSMGGSPVEALYLADMSGDGLVDLVRVRNAEVCYWPNLGYGRFGAKIVMTNSPLLDGDQFDPARTRLADVDGSGTTDVLYLGADEVRIHQNQAGNGFGAVQIVNGLPSLDRSLDVSVVDLLGSGTPCLVLSPTLPPDGRHPIRYVDLMSGTKPHLLVGCDNGLGSITTIGYAPSTRFYLDDRAAGQAWTTTLPFPVQVVERVEVVDAVAGNRFVTRYAYHDGTYDGTEREFRGFGIVEQWDTEAYASLLAAENVGSTAASGAAVPPRRTKTWYHTGVGTHDGCMVPTGLSPANEREADRALKGSVLRQEVYADDDTARAALPYSVSDRTYAVRLLQPAGPNRHAAFFTHARETVTHHYERDLADPRVAHELTFEVDDFGNVVRAATIGYGRDPTVALPGDDGIPQTKQLCVYTENAYTNAVVLPGSRRNPLPAETIRYEVIGLAPAEAGTVLAIDVVERATRDAPVIPPEEIPSGGLHKRVIDRSRTVYRSDDLSGPLELGRLESLGLTEHTLRLALTAGLATSVFGDRLTPELVTAGGYLSDADGIWSPSGTVRFGPDGDGDPVAELAFARAHFFLPQRHRDQFGSATTLTYDRYDLLATDVRDPVGNIVHAELDYRVLEPALLVDPNGNRTADRFDELGVVVATAQMGKDGAGEGDTLDDPTTTFEYDMHAWVDRAEPVVVHRRSREQHGTVDTRWQESYTYSDGFGREIQTKVRAEPGPIEPGGATVDERWVGTGWTVFNNKAKPVRKYEPFFTATSAFESGRTSGVSPVLCYDAAERVVATVHPNHTFEKVVYDAWRQLTWDVNDTVLADDPREDPDVGGYLARLSETDLVPSWYAQRVDGGLGPGEQAAATKAAAHAGTATIDHFDALGRAYLSLADNGPGGSIRTRTELDIQGRQCVVTDARGRIAMRYSYDLTGALVHQASMDAGERWIFNDVGGQPLASWDSRQHRVRVEYDALRRKTAEFVSDGASPERLVERITYGEERPDASAHNLRGSVYEVADPAGTVTHDDYDFKANPVSVGRRFAVTYAQPQDWSGAVPLEEEVFATTTSYDALNRPVRETVPDGSTTERAYNVAGLLESVAIVSADASTRPIVTNVDYDAKGQRVRIAYGNGADGEYTYDPLTFRVVGIRTVSSAGLVQNLTYIHDPVGNVVEVADAAQQTIFFRNRRVDPTASYTFDPLYRLVTASGREHVGQGAPTPTTASDAARVGLAHPGDGQAMSRYVETFSYDEVGNVLQVEHRGADPANPGWTRTFQYAEGSGTEAGATGNRLTSSAAGDTTARFTYDVHGNTTAMPEVSTMRWDHADRLSATSSQVVTDGSPQMTYYVYDSTGERVRKVTERAPGAVRSDRRYVGPYEIGREVSSNGAAIDERHTLHVQAQSDRLALLETRQDAGQAQTLLRYQLATLTRSSSVELDDSGAVLSYEEYYAYGATSYQALRPDIGTAKRYRFVGRERDEETGFCYHGARYYVTWLMRWASADPLGLVDGPNQYRYARDNPVTMIDPKGTDSEVPVLTPENEAMVKALFGVLAAKAAPMLAGGATPAAAAGAATGAAGGAPAAGAGGGAALGPLALFFVWAAALITADAMTVNIHMERSASIAKYGNPFGMPSGDIAFPVVRQQRVSRTAGSLPTPYDEPVEGDNRPDRPKLGRIYVTYTKYNKKADRYYSGRTSAVIDLQKPWEAQARTAVAARDANHHVDETDEPSDPNFAPSVLDKFSVGLAVDYTQRYRDAGYFAIRGREQQLIDHWGQQKATQLGQKSFSGGAYADQKTPQLTENTVRGVAKDNPLGQFFHLVASIRFGELAPFTGKTVL